MSHKNWIESFRRPIQFLILVSVLSGWSGVCEALTPPIRIMPLGDSLTKGGNSDTLSQGGYRNRLFNLLSSAGYNVDYVGTQADTNNPTIPDTNLQGMAGYRIDQIQAGIAAWLTPIEDPDVVLLMVGTDDFGQGGDLATAQTNLSNLLADIAIKRPFAKIILSTLPPRGDNPDWELRQSTFNASIPQIVSNQVALGRQVSFVDPHPVWVAGDLSSDGVHPSLTGYSKLADVWFPAITRVISPTGTSKPPAIVRIEPLTVRDHITLKFSKPLADDAVNLANFSISPSLAISQAVLDPISKRSITLTTETQIPNTLYTLTVSGIRDATVEQNPISPNTKATFFPETLINGSFEAGFTNWTNNGHLSVSFSSRYTKTDGIRVAAFNGGDLAPNATLSQTIDTVAGQVYTLKFDLGVYSFNRNSQVMQVTATGTSRLLSQSITLTGRGQGVNLWVPQSFSFVADSAATTLTFRDLSSATNSIDLLLDRVRVLPTTLPLGDLPAAVADAYSTDQGTSLIVIAPGVLTNDTHSTSAPLTAALDLGPSHGSLILNADGSFTYQPDSEYTGDDSFTYSVTDGTLSSNLVTVQISLGATGPAILTNGSFESNYAGWTFSGNQEITSELLYEAQDGAKLVVFNSGNSTPNAELSQTFTTIVGQSYILAFNAGVFSYTQNPQALEVLVTGAASLLSETVTIIGNGKGWNWWKSQSFTFVADSTTTTLKFRDRSNITQSLDLLLDHVRVIRAPSVPHSTAVTKLPTDGTTATPPTQTGLGPPVWRITPQTIAIGTTATQNGTYGLERSDDLVTWQNAGFIQITEVGPIEFQETQFSTTPAMSKKQRFYRLSLTP